MGGPYDIDSLYSIEKVHRYFPIFIFDIFSDVVLEHDKGLYHVGKGSVILVLRLDKKLKEVKHVWSI